MTQEENEAYKRTQKWLELPETQEELRESLERASETVRRLREARRVDPKILDIPMDAPLRIQ